MRDRAFWRVLACLAIFCGAGQARAACTLTAVATLPLTVAGSRLYVPVTMNGVAGSFLVDTGAERTMLTSAYAAKANVGMDHWNGQVAVTGAGGRETLRLNQAHVRRIEIGKIAFQDWEFVVQAADPAGMDATEHDGLLGMDFLHYFDIDVDVQGHGLTLWRLAGCTDIHPEWQGDYDAIPLKHTAHENVTMPIFIDNAFLDVVLDTGAGGVLLTHDAAIKAGAADATLAKASDPRGLGLGGRFPAVPYGFKLLLVGKGEFDNPVVRVQADRTRTNYDDGLMGWRYLKPRKFWISYGTNTLFVQTEGK